MPMPIPKQQSHTVLLGVAVERRPGIATIMAMIDVLRVSKQHDQHVGRRGQYNKY